MIAEIVEAAETRLAIAVSSSQDYRAALAVQADLVTHLPCYQDTENDPNSAYFDINVADDCLLDERDAQAAARLGLANTLVVSEWTNDRSEKVEAWEKENIETLRRADAKLLISVDAYGATLTDGLIAGVENDYFSATELLRIATMDTPAFIFPERSIGCLEIGCEASFIAFGSNPIEDISALRSIAYRFKDGHVIPD